MHVTEKVKRMYLHSLLSFTLWVCVQYTVAIYRCNTQKFHECYKLTNVSNKTHNFFNTISFKFTSIINTDYNIPFSNNGFYTFTASSHIEMWVYEQQKGNDNTTALR